MIYKNNWLTWGYDGVNNAPKTKKDSVFNIQFTKTIVKPVQSYYEELINNARAIRETYSGKFDLLFSGGIDSEVILRIYKELGVPLNVFIFKYENNYNHRDVSQAIKTCDALNVKYSLIDFNLEKFFENEAYSIWSKCYTGSSGWLPHMKMTEYLEGIPIIGSGEPYWRKQQDGSWMFEMDEDAKAWTVYHTTIKREVISDWYEHSPNIILSHMDLPIVNDLINNRIPGKISSYSSKGIIHKEIWPDLDLRRKLVGFEGDLPPSPNSKPEFMLEFEKEFIKDKIKTVTFKYSADQLYSIL
jgi:hypothetical protein